MGEVVEMLTGSEHVQSRCQAPFQWAKWTNQPDSDSVVVMWIQGIDGGEQPCPEIETRAVNYLASMVMQGMVMQNDAVAVKDVLTDLGIKNSQDKMRAILEKLWPNLDRSWCYWEHNQWSRHFRCAGIVVKYSEAIKRKKKVLLLQKTLILIRYGLVGNVRYDCAVLRCIVDAMRKKASRSHALEVRCNRSTNSGKMPFFRKGGRIDCLHGGTKPYILTPCKRV